MPRRLLTLLAGVTCVFAFSTVSEAQFVVNPTEVTASGTSYKIFARPGEPIIRVQVLGDIGGGIYALGAATSMSELLALAGGVPLSDASTEVSRTITVRLFRQQSGRRAMIYESTVDRLIQEPGLYPALEDGDLITVETEVRRRFNLRDALQIVSSVASVTLLILRLSDSI